MQQTFQSDNPDQLTNMFLNNNVLTVAGSLSNNVVSLTVNGQSATVYHDLTWAVPGGITLANGASQLTALVVTNTGGVTMSNTLAAMLPTAARLSYDANGNLTGDGLLGYSYGCANELTAVIRTNGWKTGYVYDGLGRRRIRKDYTWTNSAWAETNEVHYIYAGMNVIQERNSNNIPLVTYTRGVDLSGTRQGAGGIGGLLARTDANGPAYYHIDGNGNVTALVNGSGTVVAKYLYDSFGNTLGRWGSLAAGNTYRFSSKEIDARTGHYYYGYRWYAPNLQRWLNRDPIQEAGGINLYGFVGNGPVNEVDPFGFDNMYGQVSGGTWNNNVPNITLSGIGGGPITTQFNGGGINDPLLFIGGTMAGGTPLVGSGVATEYAIGTFGIANTLFFLAGLAQDVMDSIKDGKNDCPPQAGQGNQPIIGGLRQIGTGKSQEFDVHSFKSDFVGNQGSRYNVSTDEDDGSVWLAPVKPGSLENVPTGFKSLEDVMTAYPIDY